jgi:UDP-2,4-diacetamido-2,4,6-trideoxy-beta-L-altropyranose hydrolase
MVPVEIRRADASDCRNLHDWRNTPEVRSVSRGTGEIAYADHEAWFERSLQNPARWLLIGERGGAAVGVVRFDRTGADSAEVSIYLAPQAMAGGGGGALLLAAERWLSTAAPDIRRVTAVVMDGNERSERLFERGGYARVSRGYCKEIE